MNRLTRNLALAALVLSTPVAADDLMDILKAAENDNVAAQITLGGMYEHGMGVALNDRMAVYWWQRAFDNGNVDIAKGLGSMYMSGRGTPLDLEKGMALHLVAAEHGHPHAIQFVALGYKRGLGLPQDDKKAEEWAAKARALGAGGDIDVVFLDSMQSPDTELKSETEIFDEFKRQIEAGNDRAYFYMSVAYTSGTGVVRNYTEAEKWARQGAERGVSSGIRHLGQFHQLGQGVPVNRVEAQKWYYILESMLTNEDPFLGVINAKYMSKTELDQARKLADEWLAQRKKAKTGRGWE
ncbi:MAG: sel1 repeat family protein [Gammaproteobacteria bacterium]|nr:sel1 repeat family protein [Gammaproteobacteria bacterium]